MSHQELFANIPSLPFVLLIAFSQSSPTVRFVTTGEDRNKYQFKNWMLCGLWKLPFRHHGAIKFTQNCSCFINPCINAFVPTSVTREYHHKVLERLQLLQCISAHLQNTLSWEIQCLNLFSDDYFRSCLFARSRKPSKCVLKTLLRRSTHAVPIRPQKTNGSSCSSQQWHPCRRVCDCLSNSYRPGIFDFFGRGQHKLLHNSSRTGHLAQCDFFGICYFPNQHIFRKLIFPLLVQCILRRGEMASQVRFCLRAVVWRTLILTMKRGGDSTHHCRSPTPTLNGCDLTPSTQSQSSELEYSLLDGQQEAPVNTVFPQHPPQLFTRNPAIYIPEVDKTCAYVFGRLPGFLKNLLESETLVCSATATTKTALDTTQLWFNYFRNILAYTLPGRLWRDAAVVIHSLLSPFLFMGTINLPIFQCPDKTPCHLTHSAEPSGVLRSPNSLSNFSQLALGVDLAVASESLLMHSSTEAFICAKLKHPAWKTLLSGEVPTFCQVKCQRSVRWSDNVDKRKTAC